jgi:hypothetical protein
MDNRKVILGALRQLRHEAHVAPHTLHLGICYNVSRILPLGSGSAAFDWRMQRDSLFLAWPLSSGSSEFPIPRTDRMYANAHEQYRRGMLWHGEQLELRINLLDYLIERYAE